MSQMKSKNKNQNSVSNLLTLILLAVFSFAVLYICTSSSPRYAQNPWVDANAFFTVGKGMARGLIPYRDLFEQKGPLLYLIHCLAYLISNTSFTGVYIFEALSLTVTLFYVYRLAQLCLEKIPSLLVSVATGIAITNTFCFYVGDSAEEFCLPGLAAAIYYIVKFFRDPDKTDFKWYTYLFCGFLAGCIVMIKYSVIGIWFAWMAIIALYTLIVKKDIKGAFINSLIFIGGMLLAFIPWIIYFGVNGALRDFIDTYFVINSGSYSKDQTMNPVTIARKARLRYLTSAKHSRILSYSVLAGVILPTVTKRIFPKKIIPHFVVPVLFVCHTFFTYFGTGISYYYLTFAVFTPLAIIPLLSYFEMLVKNKKAVQTVSAVLSAALIIAAVPFSMKYNFSSKTVHRNIEDTVQYSFTEYMNSHNPEGKLLNIGSLDGGFYVRNNTVPAFKHFERQNIPYENYSENIDEQNRYLSEGLADYVVVRQTGKSDENRVYVFYPTLKEDYTLAKTYSEEITDVNTKKVELTFYLYEKNS